MRISLSLLVFWLSVSASAADERIMVEGARVNGTPARLAFDTGADEIYFFASAPERFHLKVSPVKNIWGQQLWTATEKCTVQFWSFSEKKRIAIISDAPFRACDCDALDGLVGWEAVRDKVLVFDTLSNTVQFVREVPKESIQWTKLRLRWNSILVLKVADQERSGSIVIDTGSESGLGLSPQKWSEWKKEHPAQPLTLRAFYMPGPKAFIVQEQAWASEFMLGPLALTDVVVENADAVSVKATGQKHTATLGLAALKRLDLVVDGRHDVAYVRPKTTAAVPINHNRAGAVFVPPDEESDTLIARVVEGSPAYEAGIRDGDVLLKIGERAITNWRTATNKASAVSEKPAGTQIPLTVQRKSETVKTILTLRDILAPSKTSRGSNE